MAHVVSVVKLTSVVKEVESVMSFPPKNSSLADTVVSNSIVKEWVWVNELSSVTSVETSKLLFRSTLEALLSYTSILSNSGVSDKTSPSSMSKSRVHM